MLNILTLVLIEIIEAREIIVVFQKASTIFNAGLHQGVHESIFVQTFYGNGWYLILHLNTCLNDLEFDSNSRV